MSEAMLRLHLVRHGETDWNREQRYQGATDAPLNDRGRAQARLLAPRVATWHADVVVASPLSRAFETAEILAAGAGLAPPVRLDELRERDVGLWGGLTLPEVREKFPDEIRRLRAGEDVRVGGGETRAEVRDRMLAALARLHAEHAGRTVVAVTHGLARRLLVAELLRFADADRLGTGENTSVTTFEFPGGAPRLVALCDAAHLTVRDAR